MGRKKKTSNALAVQVDAEGKVKYDAIARQGQGKDKVWLLQSSVLQIKHIQIMMEPQGQLLIIKVH